MARKITIPITDHDAAGVCTAQYTVQYRKSGQTGWNTNTTLLQPIEITNLEDDTLYEVRVIRECCDGIVSAPLNMNVNTTILAAPTNFDGTPADSQVGLDWDEVTGATSYTLERAEDTGFTTALTEVYVGATSSYTDIELANGTTYYYRVKATALYHADSDYSTTNATPTA